MLALRQSIRSVRSIRPAQLSVAVRTYAEEGSSGSFRGDSNSDSFTKREKANEEYYIKRHEQEALKKLRDEIEKREKDLADLKKQEKDLS